MRIYKWRYCISQLICYYFWIYNKHHSLDIVIWNEAFPFENWAFRQIPSRNNSIVEITFHVHIYWRWIASKLVNGGLTSEDSIHQLFLCRMIAFLTLTIQTRRATINWQLEPQLQFLRDIRSLLVTPIPYR